jgi:hypothetical protein
MEVKMEKKCQRDNSILCRKTSPEGRQAKEKEMELRKEGISGEFVWTSPVSGREKGFATTRDLFLAAAASSYQGERLRACIPEALGLDLRKERRRIEDNLRKSESCLYRAMADDGIYYP